MGLETGVPLAFPVESVYFHVAKSEPRLILEANQVCGKRKKQEPKKMQRCLEGQMEAMGRDLQEGLD